jgi:tetratricopeptide (TPR) repeat protein
LFEARLGDARFGAEEGLRISSEIGHHRGIWASTIMLALMVEETLLGVSTSRDRDFAAARALAEEALTMARTSKSKAALSETLGWSSRIAMSEKDFASARGYLQGAIEASQLLKNLRGTAFWLNQLAYIAMQQEDYALARISLEEAIALSQQAGDAVGAGNYQHSLGELAEAEGDYDLANTLFVESLAIARDIPMSFLVSECEWGLARLATRRGDHRDSLARVRAALVAIGNEGNPTPLVRRLAQSLVRSGHLEEAAQVLGVREAMGESRLGHKVESPLENVPEQERIGFEADLTALKQGLGAERMKELWDEGQQVAPEDAVGFALRISEVR